MKTFLRRATLLFLVLFLPASCSLKTPDFEEESALPPLIGTESPTPAPVVTTDVLVKADEMFAAKASWDSLDDISDEDISRYPALCETQNCGFRDTESGMEFYADSMTGIQRFLGLTVETDCEISFSYQVDGTNMELVLLKADGSVEHFSSAEETEVLMPIPAGDQAFGVIGYAGSGTVCVSVDPGQVSMNKMLAYEATAALLNP